MTRKVSERADPHAMPISSTPSYAQQQDALRALVRSFPKRRVLVVGDLVADHYIYGQTERVSREAPVLVVRHESSEVKLGGGANAAANVRAMGAAVTTVGLLGRDEMGRALRRHFRAQGITLQALTAAGIPTETKTRILAGGVSTTRQQVVRLDRGGATPPPAEVAAELAQVVLAASRGVDAILVSDYGAGVVGTEVRAVLRALALDGLPVCIDSRYGLRSFEGFPLLKPNEPEFEALVGRPLLNDADWLAAGRSARKLLRCESLVVTRGRKGMRVFTRKGVEDIPAHGAADAVDVTGAGDTVISALTLSLSAGASVTDAARIANVAGSLVVQKMGTATISQAELLGALPA